MHFSNYRDFYQMCLLPMSGNDIVHSDPNASHWLIAIEGHREIGHDEFYIWKVAIYETNEDGYFQNKKPYYISSNYRNFHQACEAATELKQTILHSGFHLPSPHIN
ncbi:hypothetical protein EKG37_09250 [Robertmurraya yapensis]|uniref:Uncharacterized protein n=2 Tax=Bacillaceae TaxID=186817 RepID=A0A431WA37_9BACI|nr:hypothetical protein [Bacillus yapensis]RTR32340.1 hypothetical protein EKG37_09250 [Bacillus yapensis]TKS96534.1 hypothetical protein FAR12_09250 [Bacillus yapensis]